MFVRKLEEKNGLKDIGIDNIKVDMKEMEWGCGLDPCC
jgi:alpha-glucosidase (family GH31 glycosyl hydrolase)